MKMLVNFYVCLFASLSLAATEGGLAMWMSAVLTSVTAKPRLELDNCRLDDETVIRLELWHLYRTEKKSLSRIHFTDFQFRYKIFHQNLLSVRRLKAAQQWKIFNSWLTIQNEIRGGEEYLPHSEHYDIHRVNLIM